MLMMFFSWYISSLKRLHFVVGLVFFIIFWLSGAYLKFIAWDALNNDDVLRVVFRSGHVYILMTALINLVLSSYLIINTTKNSQFVQGLGSLLLIIAPVLLTFSFIETTTGIEVRALTFLGAISMTVGVVLHIVSVYMNKIHTRQNN